MTKTTNPSLILVGPMGAGKSTLGRHLSQVLDYPFFDSDRVIEEKTGADIPWIFDMEGEAGFRRRTKPFPWPSPTHVRRPIRPMEIMGYHDGPCRS